MIVQSAAEGQPHLVITMDQHTALAASFAKHFGNQRFERVEPFDLMLYIIGHHDAGWKDLDQQALRDPSTGLPYNLVQTPFEHIVATSSASPDFNSLHHPYCGLISSMHSWGLYNGRYGMSDKVLLDSLADENRTIADNMLNAEMTRQDQLKSELAEDPETKSWIEHAHLFQNYKQLQFFDTLALYFNCTHMRDREAATFSHVPISADEDVDVRVEPLDGDRYLLDPFPFDTDELALKFSGRYLSPIGAGTSVASSLDGVETTTERFIIVAPAATH
ncbi:MAG: DUF3891 family protein [Gammaproteobacteria bacterium]